MIDEKKLIEETQKYFVNNSIHKNDLAEVISNLPRVGEWIPCSEMLPEEGAVVLVSLEKDEDYDWVRLVREGYYDEGYWFDVDGAHYGVEVIAWMPLPEPYKEGE